jgi:bis(5'-nucleosidyl)-tetraphosphatase
MKSNSIVEAAGLLLVTYAKEDIHQPEKFLLLRHRDRWDLPKGHCERGETLVETALRETREETGFSRKKIRLIPEFSFAIEYPVTYSSPKVITLTKKVTYFLGSVAAPHPVLCTEHESYQWFKWSPPHSIQAETIDSLLAAAASFFEQQQRTR